MEFLRQLARGIAQAWKRLSLSARVNLVLAAVATAAAILAIVFVSSRVQYVRLYEELDPAETTQIVSILGDEGIASRIQDGGKTIQVAQDRLSDAKMAVSSQGLPTTQGRVAGFELFRESDMLTSQRDQDIKYMMAVQGELQRQLNEFTFIRKSFVFIREAEEELFADEQRPSEASVTLDVTRPPSEMEKRAILHTISSFGGANLTPENITLTTTEGVPLHLPPDSDFAAVANSKLEYVATLEKQREARALEDLKALGKRAVVRVSAVVDFDAETETVSKAEEGALLSSWTTTVASSSTEKLPEGAPGAVTNLPEGTAAAGGTETTESTEEVVENYEPTVTKTETVREPGKVRQYIVSAIIEGDTETGTDAEGNETTEYVGLTAEEKKKYEDHIIAAVGQGDTPTLVTVNDHPFDITALAEARVAFAEIERAVTRDLWYGRAWMVGRVLLIIALGLLTRWLLLRVFVTVEETEEEEEMHGLGVEASAEDKRRQEVAAEVERLSQEDPEAVAALLRSWMAQDEE